MPIDPVPSAATAEDRQFIASSSYEEDLAAPPPQPQLTQSQMQAKVETYQKYLQKVCNWFYGLGIKTKHVSSNKGP